MSHGDMYAPSKSTQVWGAIMAVTAIGGFLLILGVGIHDAVSRSNQIEACRQKNAGAPCEIKSLAVPKE